MVAIDTIGNQKSEGRATVLAIGTATPQNFIDQKTYPDFYFRVTDSEHLTELKQKFQRICDKSDIRKRHMYLTEEMMKDNPNLCEHTISSLDVRQDIVVEEVPKLGKQAAIRAIEEWGQPKSKLTHLIFTTTSGIDMPGADYQLTKLLGLDPSINRYMMYNLGCYGGGTVLRVAKDIAENNKGSRILIVCSDMNTILFRGPNEDNFVNLVGQALFGDGAAAVIVGSDPEPEIENPLFEVISTAQTLLPDSEGGVEGHLREMGMTFHLHKDVPKFISTNIEKCLQKAFQPLGISDWNSIFWMAHPGGPAILDQIESKLGLDSKKLRSSRRVLAEYGNLSAACVLFVMDHMRKKSVEEGLKSTGEGLEWGVLFGFGPGLTVETVVLRSMAI